MNKVILRERLHQNPDALTDHDLLRLAGVRTKPTAENFLDMSIDELLAAGFSHLEATTIKTIKELSIRYLSQRMENQDVLTSPQRVVDFLRAKIGGLPHEAFAVIYLTTQNRVIGCDIINEGTVDQVAVYPRRVIEKALARHAAGIILAHNHPSGYTDPSEEDKNLTRTLRTAATVLDIRLLDHLIVGRFGYFSFVERGLI